MSKSIFVTIETNGRIPLIGGNGPILVPTKMSSDLVKKLVMCGVRVNEHNPNDFKQKVRITRSNVDKNRFPPEVPKPVEFPVGKEVPTVSLGKPTVTIPKVEEVPEEPTVEETSMDDTTEEVHHTSVSTNPIDKYAGMSKNQRKRMRQQEAAARAAQQTNPQENASAE